MADIFAREESLNLTRPHKVAVVGCGGVGSWVAYLLAMAGVEELWLFDMDTVSDHNRNRVPVLPDHVGKLKTTAMADMISMVRPTCRVYAMRSFTPEIVAEVGIFDGVHLEYIIATTDTHASRQMVYKWAQDMGVAYMEAAAEGECGSITGAPAEWATPEEAQPGYASVPVWVGSSVAAALMACYYVLHGLCPYDNSYRLEWELSGAGEQRLRFTHHGPDAPENDPASVDTDMDYDEAMVDAGDIPTHRVEATNGGDFTIVEAGEHTTTAANVPEEDNNQPF
jgi:hypothetical protein